MNRETLLAGAIVLVVAVSSLAAAVVPGAMASPNDDVREGSLRIQEMTIAPGAVSGGTATLTVDTRLEHWGGRTENVSVLVRAVHLESGLVEATTEKSVASISEKREVSVVQNLSVARAGGYRIETVVFRDGERVAEGRKQVRGVGNLQPAYARTSVRFHWQDGGGLPPVEYTVADAGPNRTTLNVSTYLTNEGDDTSGDLRVVFTARQADSNIVADRAAVSVATLRPGRTGTPSVELTVPSEYNYYLDAVLWKDGVVVGTVRSVANLDPTETLKANQSVREVGIEVSDFESDSDGPSGATKTTLDGSGGSGSAPGFGAGLTALAILGGLLLARRRR